MRRYPENTRRPAKNEEGTGFPSSEVLREPFLPIV